MVGPDACIAVYLLASARNGTLYTGVTSALWTRISQHKLGTFEGFSKTDGCKRLVWFERHLTMLEAIQREKQIKRWRRAWKLALIEADNPQWRAIYRTAGSRFPKGRCRGRSAHSSPRRGRSGWVPDLRALTSASSGMTEWGWGEVPIGSISPVGFLRGTRRCGAPDAPSWRLAQILARWKADGATGSNARGARTQAPPSPGLSHSAAAPGRGA